MTTTSPALTLPARMPCGGLFLALEDDGRAAELHHAAGSTPPVLTTAPLGARLPKSIGQAAALAVGLVQRADDVGVHAPRRRRCSRPASCR